jgi:hypothetical protein
LRLEAWVNAIEAHKRCAANSFENAVTEHKVIVAAARQEHRAEAVP